MKTTFHAAIRKQSSSFIVTIPTAIRKMLELKPKQIKKFTIEDEDESQ